MVGASRTGTVPEEGEGSTAGAGDGAGRGGTGKARAAMMIGVAWPVGVI